MISPCPVLISLWTCCTASSARRSRPIGILFRRQIGLESVREPNGPCLDNPNPDCWNAERLVFDLARQCRLAAQAVSFIGVIFQLSCASSFNDHLLLPYASMFSYVWSSTFAALLLMAWQCFVGRGQYIFPIHLVVERMETKKSAILFAFACNAAASSKH